MNSETLNEMSNVFALKLQSFSDDSSESSHSWCGWPSFESDFHWWSEWTNSERVGCEGIHSEYHWSSYCTEKGGADQWEHVPRRSTEVWIKRHWHGSGMTMQCKFETESKCNFTFVLTLLWNAMIQFKKTMKWIQMEVISNCKEMSTFNNCISKC